MRRINGQRREHRKNTSTKLGDEVIAIGLVEVGDRSDRDPLLLEGRRHVPGEEIGAPLQQVSRPLVDGTELLTGRHAVGRCLWEGGMDLLFQTGDADLEELVDVLAKDRQEAHSLEQGQRLVLRQSEHPFVEVELGELPVEVPRLGLNGGGMNRRSIGGPLMDGGHRSCRHLVPE